MYLMRAESPGPTVGKLVPRVKHTARILYEMYIFMTVIQIILLLITGMSLFESMTLSFGTAGTGGFGVLNSSIGSYSIASQAVITIFMILFGINFNVYYFLWVRKPMQAFRHEEMRCYLGIILYGCFTDYNQYPGRIPLPFGSVPSCGVSGGVYHYHYGIFHGRF